VYSDLIFCGSFVFIFNTLYGLKCISHDNISEQQRTRVSCYGTIFKCLNIYTINAAILSFGTTVLLLKYNNLLHTLALSGHCGPVQFIKLRKYTNIQSQTTLGSQVFILYMGIMKLHT